MPQLLVRVGNPTRTGARQQWHVNIRSDIDDRPMTGQFETLQQSFRPRSSEPGRGPIYTQCGVLNQVSRYQVNQSSTIPVTQNFLQEERPGVLNFMVCPFVLFTFLLVIDGVVNICIVFNVQ